MKKYDSVEHYLESIEHWRPELNRLREVMQETDLTEALKWSAPCYMFQGKNVVGIGGFKSYFGLWFFNGAFLDDSHSVLLDCSDGKTKGLRQWRMTSMAEIKPRIIKTYVKRAIELVKKGIEVKPDRSRPVITPPELLSAFAKNRLARTRFEEMGKGLQREFAEYIETAKRPETKLARIEKILPMILDGIGLNDKYRSNKKK